MATPINVLVLEDNPADAKLAVHELRRAGFDPNWRRVDTREDFVASLQSPIDVILSDFSMPQFDAMTALELIRSSGMEVPFIIVSGTIGEDVAVTAMRQGATDYLLKDRLGRLGQAVTAALQQQRLRDQHRQIQRELLESEQRIRHILDSANDPFLCMDEAGRITDWNARAESVFGWTKAEVLGRLVSETIVPFEYRQPHTHGLERYLKHGGGRIVNAKTEMEALRRDGTRLPVELEVWPVKIHGKLTFSAFVHDISNRKKHELVLLERAQLAALGAHVGDALNSEADINSMLQQCAEGLVKHLDAAVARIWTLDSTEQVLILRANAGPTTNLDGRYSRIPVGSMIVGHIAEQRQPHVTNDLPNDPYLQDPQWAIDRGLIAAAGYPLLIADRMVGVLAIFSKKTLSTSTIEAIASVAKQVALGIERKRAEETLRGANQWLKSLISVSPLGIAAIDRQGKVLLWNPACERIFGWSEQEVLHKLLPVVPFDQADKFEEQLQREFSGQPLSGEERQGVHKDGRSIICNFWSAPLYDAHGNMSSSLQIIVDITEQKRLEEQFRAAQRMEAIGRLAGGVAHDFNNLLTVILGYSNMLLTDLPDSDPNAEMIQEIHQAGERAKRLTRQLLAFSRKQLLEPRVVDPNVLIQDLLTILRRLIGEHIELRLDLSSEHSLIEVDPGQFEQVLLNLAVNARDAISQNGIISIRTGLKEVPDSTRSGAIRPGRYFRLELADNGCGIPKEAASRIFEPFFTTKGPEAGTGLGLSVVHGIVTQSNGYISFDSEPSKGTTFEILLPTVDKAFSPKSGSGAVIQGGDETILLVEDESVILTLTRKVLTSLGYQVLHASNGNDAIAIANGYAGRINLLLTDVVMPEISGVHLYQKLSIVRPDMKVLYMSGYLDDAIKQHFETEIPPAILNKPFAREDLALKVRQVIDN